MDRQGIGSHHVLFYGMRVTNYGTLAGGFSHMNCCCPVSHGNPPRAQPRSASIKAVMGQMIFATAGPLSRGVASEREM